MVWALFPAAEKLPGPDQLNSTPGVLDAAVSIVVGLEQVIVAAGETLRFGAETSGNTIAIAPDVQPFGPVTLKV